MKIALLSSDAAKVVNIFENETGLPLSELYEASYVARCLDITNQNPPPQVGWSWDGVHFTAPSPPTKAQLLATLETLKQAYIDQHYPAPTREWLIAYCLNPAASDASKTTILTAWNWVNTVVAYQVSLQGEINLGTLTDLSTVNFSQFDAADPKVTVQAILGA